MSGTSTKRYVIKYHPDLIDDERGSYGVHFRNGQIIGNYPTLERAERAMMRFVKRDKRMDETFRMKFGSAK